ncbi:MAG: hypothetical protein Q9184_003578 [Pyrenodesmia sp. 2 TL-2023]
MGSKEATRALTSLLLQRQTLYTETSTLSTLLSLPCHPSPSLTSPSSSYDSPPALSTPSSSHNASTLPVRLTPGARGQSTPLADGRRRRQQRRMEMQAQEATMQLAMVEVEIELLLMRESV